MRRSGTGSPARRRAVTRWALGALAVIVAAGVGLTIFLRRDPLPLFASASRRIAAVHVEAGSVSGRSSFERLSFLDEKGSPLVAALIRSPAGPVPVRRTLVVYAGRRTGSRVLDLIPPRPDVSVVAPIYPEIGTSGLVDALALPARVRGAVFTTVAAGMAALDHLEAAGIPRGRTAVLAASLGSSFGTLHAALDERVDELVVVHGGGDFPRVLRHVYRRRGRPVLAATLPLLAEVVLDSFDPVHWIGEVAPRPVFVIASRRDELFPVESVEALYRAARPPKRIRWTDTDHVGASRAEIVATLVAEIEAYLDSAQETIGEER